MSTSPGSLDQDLHPVALAIFGERLPIAERYAHELATSGVLRGLIGPREVDRLWERHVLNCAVLAELVDDGLTVVDVGSGAGLPGIPLALARPGVTVVLVEPLLRRTQWLDEVVTALALPNVVVERARAEESAFQGRADIVTGRAVAQLARFVPLAVPLLKEPGSILALKGQAALEELADAGPSLPRFGVTESEVLQCGSGLLEVPTTVVRLTVPRRVEAGGQTTVDAGSHRPPKRSKRRPRG